MSQSKLFALGEMGRKSFIPGRIHFPQSFIHQGGRLEWDLGLTRRKEMNICEEYGEWRLDNKPVLSKTKVFERT